MHIFITKSISVSNTKRTEIGSIIVVSYYTVLPLMHIAAKSKSISSKNTNNKTRI